jgi:alpha-galactosidase
LIIGTDLTTLASEEVEIFKNKYLLAFSQDAKYGKPATPYKWGINKDWTFNATNPAEYWSGQSLKGMLVLALNTLDIPAQRYIVWKEVLGLINGKGGTYEEDGGGKAVAFWVEDIWTGRKWCAVGGVGGLVGADDTIGFLAGGRCNRRSWKG